MEKSQHTDFNEDKINESASEACSHVWLWKLDTQEELRNTSWGLWDERTEKDAACFVDSNENKWMGSQQNRSKEGTVRQYNTIQYSFNKIMTGTHYWHFDTVKARKLAYYGHIMRKQGNCVEKETMQGTMPGVRRRGRPRRAWIDSIKSWTGLSVEE